MDDSSQIEVPDSFVELFRRPGRLKLTEPRAVIAVRYELCEDLANSLFEYARAQHFDLGISEDEVLARCYTGLVAPGAGVEPHEAAWVVQRLAELQSWPFTGRPGAKTGP